MHPRVRTDVRFATDKPGFAGLTELTQADEPLDSEVLETLSQSQLNVVSYWGIRAELNLLQALHVSCKGPVMRLLPHEQDTSEFIKEHISCLEANRCMVVLLGQSRQLLLAPVNSTSEDGVTTAVYWGFVAANGLPSLTTQLLEKSQLAVILDLDETLLVANSCSSLENKIEACKKAREAHAGQLSNDTQISDQDRERLLSAVACLTKEEDLLGLDLDLLQQFVAGACVKINGKLFTPAYETAYLEDGTTTKRPVIRLCDGLVILTRIDASRPITSMIIRVRPGWDDLRKYLSGELDGKQRFDVYVCTAAERTYALEVWRLLDTAQAIIPPHQRSRLVTVKNVTSGGSKKAVLHALGLLGVAEAAAAATAMAAVPQDSPGNFPPALTVVVDDRLEVWEDVDQGNILQVMPWMYYRDEAQRLCEVNRWTAGMSERELARVRNGITQIRGEIYQTLDKVVTPQLEAMKAEGIPESRQLENLYSVLPTLKTVPSVLKDATWCSVYGMPRLVGQGRSPPRADVIGPSNAAYLPLAAIEQPKPKVARAATLPASSTLARVKSGDLRRKTPDVPAPAPAPVPAEPRAPVAQIQDTSMWDLSNMEEDVMEDAPADGAAAGDNKTMALGSVPSAAPTTIAQPTVNQEQVQTQHQQAVAALLGLSPGADVATELKAQAHLPVGQVTIMLCDAVTKHPDLLQEALLIRRVCTEKPASAVNIKTFLSAAGTEGVPERVKSLAGALENSLPQPPSMQALHQTASGEQQQPMVTDQQQPEPLQPMVVNGVAQAEGVVGKEGVKAKGVGKRDAGTREDGLGGERGQSQKRHQQGNGVGGPA